MQNLPAELILYILENFCDELSVYMCLFVSKDMAQILKLSPVVKLTDHRLIQAATQNYTEGTLRQLCWLRSRFALVPFRHCSQMSEFKDRRCKMRYLAALGQRDALRTELRHHRKSQRSLDSSVFCLAAILRNGDVMSLLRNFQCPVTHASRCAESAGRFGNLRWLRARCLVE